MKDILVFVSSAIEDRISAGASYALALARDHSAHLSVLITEIEPRVHNVPIDPDIMQGGEVRSERVTSSERPTKAVDPVLAAGTLANVTCEILEADSQALSTTGELISLVQMRDLVVLDVYGPIRERRRTIVASILVGSGRPRLLVPQNARESENEKIMIAWDATRSAVRAVHDALPMLTRASDVTIVSVIDDKTYLTPESGAGLVRYLARWNVASKMHAIKRDDLDVGMSLLIHSKRVGANLLVMGGHAHAFERTLMFGSATRDIFGANLEIPVLLSH
jgi:nucleotide-binding universal stress UspA family protein